MTAQRISIQGVQFTDHVARVTFCGVTVEGRIVGMANWGTILEVTLVNIGDVWRWKLHIHNPDEITITVRPRDEKQSDTAQVA